ncbi:hypothetical protein I552_0001 [Mycobacterium xenopi 3993]|nr:hypothetical protein I552_0001 [Mycobacterium xenopi 3993]
MPASPALPLPERHWYSRCGGGPGCGPQTPNNALLGAFYVLLWVGLVALSLLFGPVWRVLSPCGRFTCCFCASPPAAASSTTVLPESWDIAGRSSLFAFVWMELASPNSASPPAVETWLLVYAVVLLVGAWCAGSAGWPG